MRALCTGRGWLRFSVGKLICSNGAEHVALNNLERKGVSSYGYELFLYVQK